MATEIVEMGTVSSRGQIAIPSSIRQEMGLEEGSKILFVLKDHTVVIKKFIPESWEEVTKPFREAKKKIKEDEVDALIHKLRKKWRENSS